MLSAYEFYKLLKEKEASTEVVEFRKSLELLSEAASIIERNPLSGTFKSSLPHLEKAEFKNSGSRRLSRTRKRPHSPKFNNAKRHKATESTKDSNNLAPVHCQDIISTEEELDSIPDLVPGSVIEGGVIDPLHLGQSLFNFLIFPLSTDVFRKDYYGLKPFHSVGGKKRCNLNSLFPIQKLDILISTKRLFFGKDVEFINADSSFSGRAYRSKIWSEFADGTSVRFLLPERYFIQFGVKMGLLQDIFNGPIYSVVTFVTNSFEGPLIDTKSPSCPPGDVFIILLENYFTIKATPLDDFTLKVDSNVEKSWNLKAGDVLYLPASYSHEVKLEMNCQHAIALCIVNRTPTLIKEWGNRLIETIKVPQVSTRKSLFRQLLDSTNDPEVRGGSLYLDLNAPSEIVDGVRKWLKGDDMKFDLKDVEMVRGAVVELQKEFMRNTPLLYLHDSELDFHITTYGACWEDPNYDTDQEDENTSEILHLQADGPRLEGTLFLEDLDLDLRSSIRIARRSAVCVVEESTDPENIYLYHTYLNSIDAREMNEPCALKMPRDDITLSMIYRLVKTFPQPTAINELAKESEEAKTRFTNTLFDNGLIIATSIWEREEGVDIEDSGEEADKELNECEEVDVTLEGDKEEEDAVEADED
ncbi:hypothetical protein Aperf_G00000108591 [Anoplocephala perfoliata]